VRPEANHACECQVGATVPIKVPTAAAGSVKALRDRVDRNAETTRWQARPPARLERSTKDTRAVNMAEYDCLPRSMYGRDRLTREQSGAILRGRGVAPGGMRYHSRRAGQDEQLRRSGARDRISTSRPALIEIDRPPPMITMPDQPPDHRTAGGWRGRAQYMVIRTSARRKVISAVGTDMGPNQRRAGGTGEAGQ